MYTLYKLLQIIMFTLYFASFTYADQNICVFDEIFNEPEISKLYKIDSNSSQVTFRVNSSIGQVDGGFQSFYGGMSLNKHGRGEGYTALIIQADTLDTESGFIDALLRSENFFNVDKYKDIMFVSREFRWISNNHATLTGELTIRDITHIIVFDIALMDAGDDKIDVIASTYIDREAFGMDSLSAVVDNDVELVMHVRATKYR